VRAGYAKDAIANGQNMARQDGCRYDASLYVVHFASADQKEGMEAFIAKRPAVFSGK
jgi:enoyl-CoA hydratase